MRAGSDGDAKLARELACAGLVAQQFDGARVGSGEHDPLFFTACRERGVLAQEAVAGVDRIATSFLRNREDALRVKIGRWPVDAERHRFSASMAVQGRSVVA